MPKSTVALALVVSIAGASPCALAQDAPAEAAGLPAAAGGDQPAPAPTARRGWFEQHRPEHLSGELGVVYGMLFPSSDHNFHDEAIERQQVNPAGPDFGLRAGFYPLSFVGVEVEGVLAPTSTEDGVGATLWAGRAHGVLQLPIFRITPFVLFGGGYMGLLSNQNGNDGDPLVHYGGGIRFGLNDMLAVRVDVRDNLTQKNGAELGETTHHPEVLAGLSVRFYPHEPKAAAAPAAFADLDGDGYVGEADLCPQQRGGPPDGCPLADADRDGLPDGIDKCPQEAGQAPHGCPATDRDKDGFLDHEDQCPDQPGVSPDGCAPRDDDADAVPNNLDRCPGRPETPNGYQDDDGCPDELPAEVTRMIGVLEGLEFEPGTASIVSESTGALNRVADVLRVHAWAHVLVTGHTDNVGNREANVELSLQRAEAVKSYLIAQGIEASRVQTRGAGPDEPLASNNTEAGRRKNQRVELYVIAASAEAGAGGDQEIESLGEPLP
jgi:outer membrane protein OmpA-like peptidoglycan-associated protein